MPHSAAIVCGTTAHHQGWEEKDSTAHDRQPGRNRLPDHCNMPQAQHNFYFHLCPGVGRAMALHQFIVDMVPRDALSRHVSDADEALSVGSANQEGINPFLDIKLLIETALSVEADAIHPGYGYLSENADFADATRAAGLIFIGPSSKAMSTLGDKRTSKDYLREFAPQVPLIPGFSGSSQNVEDLEVAAAKIGFPVMLKASAGGGGRGMRIVYERSKLQSELGRATSEAARSFGSGDCILEKYIEAGKHIEIQIIGDSHGNVISLYDRECSIQRRHQKVIEETPSPWLSTLKRQEMSDVAVQIGQLLAYEGAGTVEFVVDVKDGKFYFLEVNTRLQVEHPITEEVTGLDIVSLQTFVAAGGSLASLPALQQVRQDGHAIECRLCAEDPQRDFFPEHGTIRLWQPAPAPLADSRDIRYETAVQTGSQISIYFDSMIAKIVVWAPTRSIAIEKMVKTLANTVCAGLRTNQLFLQSCLLHEKFRDPAYTTSFIPSHSQDLIKNPYHDRSSDLSAVLALIPSVFMRKAEHTLTSTSAARPFQHVRRGFRNQRLIQSISIAILLRLQTRRRSKKRLSACGKPPGRQIRNFMKLI
jgi:acetyl/propionyl-CoA carboxylase alpha subunit